jgi:hypothetical protein
MSTGTSGSAASKRTQTPGRISVLLMSALLLTTLRRAVLAGIRQLSAPYLSVANLASSGVTASSAFP